jgi:hypothetical protein
MRTSFSQPPPCVRTAPATGSHGQTAPGRRAAKGGLGAIEALACERPFLEETARPLPRPRCRAAVSNDRPLPRPAAGQLWSNTINGTDRVRPSDSWWLALGRARRGARLDGGTGGGAIRGDAPPSSRPGVCRRRPRVRRRRSRVPPALRAIVPFVGDSTAGVRALYGPVRRGRSRRGRCGVRRSSPPAATVISGSVGLPEPAFHGDPPVRDPDGSDLACGILWADGRRQRRARGGRCAVGCRCGVGDRAEPGRNSPCYTAARSQAFLLR